MKTLISGMNEIQELIVVRLGPKTKVVFTSSPGYASMPPALQFVYAELVLIVEVSGLRTLLAAPNQELEPKNLKSEVAAAWADISHALRGLYELAHILVVLDEVLCLEISKLARQLKLKPEIIVEHYDISHLWFLSGNEKQHEKPSGALQTRRGGATT